MSVGEWIGLMIAVLVFLWGLAWGLIRFGRTIGHKEKDIEHTDQSLQARIKRLEEWKTASQEDLNTIGNLARDVENLEAELSDISSKIEGGEFWERMKAVIREVKSGTDRIKRDSE